MIFVYVDRYISPFEGGRGDVFIIRELGVLPPNSHRKYINN